MHTIFVYMFLYSASIYLSTSSAQDRAISLQLCPQQGNKSGKVPGPTESIF